MSERATPETDASRGYALNSHYGRAEGSYLQMDKSGPFVHAEVARKLERERNEAREEWGKASMDAAQLLSEKTKAIAERDEAREALLKIEEIYIDSDNTYDDWKAMGDVARKAVERWI